MLKGICQKEGKCLLKYLSKGGNIFVKIFVKRRVIYLLKICQKEGNICQKEGNIFVKRYLSKGG